jgi:tellurite resistance protein
VHVAKVDAEFAIQEKALLQRLIAAIKLSPEERRELLNHKVSLAEGLAQLSSLDAKNLLVKTLCAVSHSDGKAVKQELDFISKVIDSFGGHVFVYSKDEWGRYEAEVLTTLDSLKF